MSNCWRLECLKREKKKKDDWSFRERLFLYSLRSNCVRALSSIPGSLISPIRSAIRLQSLGFLQIHFAKIEGNLCILMTIIRLGLWISFNFFFSNRRTHSPKRLSFVRMNDAASSLNWNSRCLKRHSHWPLSLRSRRIEWISQCGSQCGRQCGSACDLTLSNSPFVADRQANADCFRAVMKYSNLDQLLAMDGDWTLSLLGKPPGNRALSKKVFSTQNVSLLVYGHYGYQCGGRCVFIQIVWITHTQFRASRGAGESALCFRDGFEENQRFISSIASAMKCVSQQREPQRAITSRHSAVDRWNRLSAINHWPLQLAASLAEQ